MNKKSPAVTPIINHLIFTFVQNVGKRRAVRNCVGVLHAVGADIWSVGDGKDGKGSLGTLTEKKLSIYQGISMPSLKTTLLLPLLVVTMARLKYRKNCECCPRHSLFKGHNLIVNIVVLSRTLHGQKARRGNFRVISDHHQQHTHHHPPCNQHDDVGW